MIRAVLDTTVAVAAGKSQSSNSPNREIINRWLQGEFTLLLSKDIAAEYATKLRERGVGDHAILTFLRQLAIFPSSKPFRNSQKTNDFPSKN